MNHKKIVVALGGNAIIKKGQEGNISEQFDNTNEAMRCILPIIKEGNDIILTHGNGPTVGDIMMRVEAGLKGGAPYIPLGICVADSQGGLGFMLELCLRNELYKAGIEKDITTLITPVLIDRDDPSFSNPTKPIGQFYTKKEVKNIKKLHKEWIIKEVSNNSYRRVVPSPEPSKIINCKTIRKMFNEGYIVIAAGGGGVPVIYRNDGKDNGTLKGVPAVIDKDKTAALLGKELGCDSLMILTAIDKVYLNYETSQQKALDEITVEEAKQYLKEDHFGEGSMKPKIEAAINFLDGGGKEVTICDLAEAYSAYLGKAGTKIIKCRI